MNKFGRALCWAFRCESDGKQVDGGDLGDRMFSPKNSGFTYHTATWIYDAAN